MYSPSNFHRRRRWRVKTKERNILAAVLSIVVLALLATSLSQPRWFYFRGGSCVKKYLGLSEFFYIGYFETQYSSSGPQRGSPNEQRAAGFDSGDGVTQIVYHGDGDIMVDCVTVQIVTLTRFIITFVFLGIFSSLFAFFANTLGVTHRMLKILKRNAVGSVLTVVFSVVVIGLCYFVSTLIAHQQEQTKANRGTRVEVKFDVGFYLITAAGAVAVLAAAANLLRRYPLEGASSGGSSGDGPDGLCRRRYAHLVDEDDDDDALLEEFDGLETFSVNHPSGAGRLELTSHQLAFLPPPPPYTP